MKIKSSEQYEQVTVYLPFLFLSDRLVYCRRKVINRTEIG
jgi:hypothetical protein